MKRFITLTFLLLSNFCWSQKEIKYVAQIDFGIGGTLFNIPNTLNVLSIPRAFANTFKVDATVNVKRPLSIGFSFASNQFKTETDSNTNFIEARGGSLLFIANYHLVDNRKFNFCVGSGFGVNGLNYTRVDVVDSMAYEGKVRLEGSSFMLNLQARYYFIKNLAVFLRGQYIVNGARIKSFAVNNEDKERIDNHLINDVFFNFRGTLFQLGLSIRF